ncbi:ribosome silencing factor [Candidatus Finniella inopinata]|uniref:Ribosomal silencing factor RsfS n=2 Tax=Candidatus Finniella inopinata TaxID=1696036 RepID=A0A4Q7DGM1_9PROT|nr:ribosome silencing factor [Candidatus Finniella inopinata]
MVTLSPPELIELITEILDDRKALDIVILDLKDRGAIVDYMIIASATSGRQVGALADTLSQSLKQRGILPVVEGMAQADWVLVDAGDVWVHIFKPDIRLFYNLEKMWSGAQVPSDLIVA